MRGIQIHSAARKGERVTPDGRFRRVGWADLAVVPLVVVLSIPALYWFAHVWLVTQDAGRYLLGGWHLVSGRGYTLLNGTPEIKRGPVFAALLGFWMLVFGRDTESIAWAVRLLTLLNPILAYLLVRRLFRPTAGLVAAALVTLFNYTAVNPEALNIDAVLLTVYLLSLLALLFAVQKDTVPLALLSGLLLGTAIITKETSFVNLPLALLAVFLLGWSLRGALWHYAGVALVCLPWWAWVFYSSREVFLIGRLSAGAQAAAVAAAVAFAGIVLVGYLSGAFGRLLADERRRRRAGLLVILVWTLLLCGFLLSSGSAALAHYSLDDLRRYVALRLEPGLPAWPLLLVAVGYVVWRAIRGGSPWRAFAVVLLFQVPIVLLVTVEGWHPRQFLTPQTLLLCALAVLVADAGELLAESLRRRRFGRPLAVAAAVLVVGVLAATGSEVRYLLVHHPPRLSGGGRTTVEAVAMNRWLAKNVPAGRMILIPPPQSDFVTYLDGDRHRLLPLGLSQHHSTNPTVSGKGRFSAKNSVYATPPGTVWLSVDTSSGVSCGATSISTPHVTRQMEKQDSGLLMMTSYPTFPGLLSSSLSLRRSGAFEIVHQEGSFARDEGFVLMRRTGAQPQDAPVWMGTSAVIRLKSCEQKKGPGYAQRIRSRFPAGISLVARPNPIQDMGKNKADLNARARQTLDRIYPNDPSETNAPSGRTPGGS